MRAIVFDTFGSPDVLHLREVALSQEMAEGKSALFCALSEDLEATLPQEE